MKSVWTIDVVINMAATEPGLHVNSSDINHGDGSCGINKYVLRIVPDSMGIIYK